MLERGSEMGLKQKIVSKYGIDYWNEHQAAILKRANKHGSLMERTIEYNSATRRAMRRHPELYSSTSLREALEDFPDDQGLRKVVKQLASKH